MTQITTPDDPLLAELCRQLAALAARIDAAGEWPAEQLRLCGEYGVYRWFGARESGGLAWDHADILRGYLALSTACLTTAFILTQREGACRRLEESPNAELKRRLLPDLTAGATFATVGISHLTTSRRHAAQPVLQARRSAGGFVLDGFSPWVTGAPHADYVLLGASVMEGSQNSGEQILAMLPTNLPGVSAPAPEQLTALSASHTGRIVLEGVELAEEWLLFGPAENVMSLGVGAGTGGLQTSTLALGLASTAVGYLRDEAARRPDLEPALAALSSDIAETEVALFAAAEGVPRCTNDELRQRANNLALRSTQAALAAAKGSGYVAGHPAGRWCREALFFLVWSCPQPVLSAHLCEFAGILD